MKLRLLALLMLIGFGASAQTTPWGTLTVTSQTRKLLGANQIRWLWGSNSVLSWPDSSNQYFIQNQVAAVQAGPGFRIGGPGEINIGSLGTGITPVFSIINPTAATNVLNQNGPFFQSSGFGWGGSSQAVNFLWGTVPGSGSGTPSGEWELFSQVNGGSKSLALQVSLNGTLGFNNYIAKNGELTGGIFAASGSALASNNHSTIYQTADNDNLYNGYFGATFVSNSGLATVTVSNGGSAYTNGTYPNTPIYDLTTGSTLGIALGTVVISGGAIVSITPTTFGARYGASDNLTVLASDVGGTGSGLAAAVNTLHTYTGGKFRDLQVQGGVQLNGLGSGTPAHSLAIDASGNVITDLSSSGTIAALLAGNNTFTGVNTFSQTPVFNAGITSNGNVAVTGDANITGNLIGGTGLITTILDIGSTNSAAVGINFQSSYTSGPNYLWEMRSGSSALNLQYNGGVVWQAETDGKLYDASNNRYVTTADLTGFGTGTVTNVATGLGLSGGPITGTGTIIADTTVLKSKAGFLTDYNNLTTSIATKLATTTAASTYLPLSMSGDKNVLTNGHILNLGSVNNGIEVDDLDNLVGTFSGDGSNSTSFNAQPTDINMFLQLTGGKIQSIDLGGSLGILLTDYAGKNIVLNNPNDALLVNNSYITKKYADSIGALKAPLASPTFTGTVTIPTPFTLGAVSGAVSVTSTGTQLNYLSAAGGTTGTTSTNVVFSTSPTLVTPTLGVASATSINKVAITAPATSATLTIANGKTFTASNTITFTATDGNSYALPAASQTLASLAGTEALTNKTINGNTITAGSGTLALANSLSITFQAKGDATLVSGTKAISITGATTSSRAQVTRTVASGTSLTQGVTAVCTAGTLTITADLAAGTINTADGSTYTYTVTL